MNFTPPQAWLRAGDRANGEAIAQVEQNTANASQRFQGAVAPEKVARPIAPSPVAAEQPLPGSASYGWAQHASGQARGTDYVVGDFTARAMQLATLRFDDAARRGSLLPQQHEPVHLLDDDDAAAVHLFALQHGQAVATLRLLGLHAGSAPRWPRHLAGRHVDALERLGPAAELSGLAAQAAHPAWTTLRALVRAAVYVSLAAGRRYLVVAAKPHEVRFWARFGFVRTGLGSYVPSAQPHVIELFVLDVARRLMALDTAPTTWHHLFGGNVAAIEALAPATGGVRASGWRPPLCRLASRALQLLPGPTGDAFA